MKSGENFNYSPKDYKFDPEGYNVDNEFERILREAGVKMTDNDKKIGDKKFNPPTISPEPFSASKDNLNIPNFNKKSPAPEFNSPENTFRIPDLPRKTTSEHPEVPNFAKKVSSEARDDYYERKDTNEHEKNIKDRQFGQRIEEIHDFIQKFNRAMKIHLRNTNREISGKLSEEAKELSEKTKSAISSISERLGGKKEDFKKVGKNALAVTLALTTVAGIGVASRQLKKGGTTVEETTLGYEGDAIIHDKELQDEVGEKTGEKIEEIRVDNEGNVVFVANEKKVEELSSTHDNEEEETHLSPSEDDIAGEPITNQSEKTIEEETSVPNQIKDTNEELVEDDVAETISSTSEIKNDMNIRLNLTESMKKRIGEVRKIYAENIETYKKISDKVKEDMDIFVPPELICAIHERESGCNFDTYLQNGDPLGQPTKHVPLNIPICYNFYESAVSAIEQQIKGYPYDKELYFKGNSIDTMSKITKMANRYNGVSKHVSSYVWAGTPKYEGGMYVADHVYDSNATDERPGIYALVSGLMDENLS